MSTPFQKAFPNADENTVFEVVNSVGHNFIRDGDLLNLCFDDSSLITDFKCINTGRIVSVCIDRIRIKEPELKKGDRCLVSNNGEDWCSEEFVFLSDVSDLINCDEPVSMPIKVTDFLGRYAYSFKYAKPLPKTQTVTLQDGTELTIPNDAVDKLREEYA